MNFFNHQTVRVITIIVSTIITLETVSFCGNYYKAVEYLQDNDPRSSANMTGTVVYAHPLQVFRGQEISRQELVAHLLKIGFKQSGKAEPGTFDIKDNELKINSRLPEFPSFIIRFNKGHIVNLLGAANEVSSAQIEPETLTSFVRQIKDNIAHPLWVRRYMLQASDLIPSTLYDAVRSSEDKHFESHNGIDYVNTLKAVFEHRGGSTITQQMVKNAILQDQSRTMTRKWNELALTLAVERRFTKEEVFTIYANNIFCGGISGGPALYGFLALAEETFGTRNIKNLSLAQSAVLAGMLNQPNYYLAAARHGNYEAIRTRRNRVLDLMARNYPDKYPPEKINKAKAENLAFVFTSQHEEGNQLDMITPYFESYAADNLDLINLQKNHYESGLHLFTTIDAELQRSAQAAIDKEMPRLDSLFTRRYQTKKSTHEEGKLEAALVALDPRNGQIITMIGGRDYKDSQYNCALASRSTGSAIKPFIYALALVRGQHSGPFTAASIIDPKNDTVADAYRPTDHVGNPARARVLLARSDNGAAVVTLNIAGIDQARDFIRIVTGSLPNRSGAMAVGGVAGSEVTPLNLARAYTIFPNNGLLPSLTPFAAAYKDGNQLDLHQAPAQRVLDPGPAFVTTQMCRSVVGSGHDGSAGTAKNALALAGLGTDIDIAGKTGTGQRSDVWFVGFTPRLVVAVWIGHTKNKPFPMSDGFSGGKAAVPIWAAFMRSVAKYRPDLVEGRFQQPQDVRTLQIDPDRGCVEADGGITEYFIANREPKLCR